MRLSQLRALRDPEMLWRRLVLYSKRISPRLRWQEAAGFEREWPAVRTRTLVDEPRAHTLFQLARHASRLGDFAEIGVYRGGTARLLAKIADEAGRSLHLFDTFAGMPETDRVRDLHAAGDFADTSLASVKAFLAGFRSPHFYQGMFPDTVTADVEAARFGLVHVDVDIAPSVDACCAFFYPRMVPGGVLVFDDYGFTSCPGAKQATDAFFADKAEPVMHLCTSQALVIKLPERGT